MIKTIAIGCDHAGFAYKDLIVSMLVQRGITVQDMGTHGPDSVDYPDFVHPVADSVEGGQADLGIVLCGSGNGVAMTANKHQQIRAALCWRPDLAVLARQHNDANVLALPARYISEQDALAMVAAFIDTPFEGGRHGQRVGKIACGQP